MWGHHDVCHGARRERKQEGGVLRAGKTSCRQWHLDKRGNEGKAVADRGEARASAWKHRLCSVRVDGGNTVDKDCFSIEQR